MCSFLMDVCIPNQEFSVSPDEVSLLITQKLESMVDSDPRQTISKYECRAISALFPYAILLEQGGQQQMLDAISHIAKAMRPGGLIWYPLRPFITTMFEKPNPPSLNWVLGLISPNVPWHDGPHDKNMIARQAVAASAALNPEVHWSVADELLHLAFIDSLQPFIPEDLPERPKGTRGDITHKVRALGDFGILEAYLLLVWSEWSNIFDDLPGDLVDMQASIREEFCGIEMFRHRENLIKQLNGVLVGLEHHDHSRWTGEQCRELGRVLLEVDEEAVNSLTRKPPTTCSDLLTPIDMYRIPPDLHVCSPSPIPMILHLESLGLLPLTNYFPCMPVMFLHPHHDLHFPRQQISKGIFGHYNGLGPHVLSLFLCFC